MRPNILKNWLRKRTAKQCAAIKHIEFRFMFSDRTHTISTYLYTYIGGPPIAYSRFPSHLKNCLKILTGLRRITLRGTTRGYSSAKIKDAERFK